MLRLFRNYHASLSFIPFAILFLLILFILLFGSQATAETGDHYEIKGYESVLIKDGDTLTSIANTYANSYSHYNSSEYREAIVSFKGKTRILFIIRELQKNVPLCNRAENRNGYYFHNSKW